MRSEFWQARSVLVTGHTGFKGSWLSLWLQRAGARVIGFALDPPTTPALFDLAHVAESMTSIHGDVRDVDHLRRVVQEHRPEVVFHLAAQPLVYESYRDPLKTFSTNVMGTAHVLDAVRKTDAVRAVVCVTSDKCYESRESEWGYREDDTLGGHDPYSGSKASAELVAKTYRQSFLNPAVAGRDVFVATARAGNVIGGGDWSSDRLVPDAVRALSAGEPVVVRNPHAIRPWQHVLDPLNGYLVLAERLFDEGEPLAESWNFGPPPSNARRVDWIVDRLQSLWPSASGWRQDERSQPHEDTHLTLDASKARVRLNWEALVALEDALAWIVEWHRELQDGADAGELCQRHINRFEAIVDASTLSWQEHGRAVLGAGESATTDADRRVLDLVPDPAIVRRIDGTIMYWNARAKELYGWPNEEVLGSVSHALLRTQFRLPLAEIERELLANGSWHGTLIHTTREGREICVSSYWAIQKHGGRAGTVLEFNRVADG